MARVHSFFWQPNGLDLVTLQLVVHLVVVVVQLVVVVVHLVVVGHRVVGEHHVLRVVGDHCLLWVVGDHCVLRMVGDPWEVLDHRVVGDLRVVGFLQPGLHHVVWVFLVVVVKWLVSWLIQMMVGQVVEVL